VTPGRSPSGQRLYSDADIERLRRLNLATQMGRAISQVASLPPEELARLVREDDEARARTPARDPRSQPADDLIALALDRTLALDGTGLDGLLRRALLTLGMTGFLETVASPLLSRIGDEWHAGRLAPSQEHLASAVVQRVITTATQSMTVATDAPNLLLATPAGERHEIGAVLAAAAAAGEGWRVTYLGADLPAGDIADAAIRSNARAVGLSVVYVPDRQRVLEELRVLCGRLPAGVLLLIGGAAGASLANEIRGDGVRPMHDLAELRAVLRRNAGAVPV
jgi:methanogenic corrinoid protein MtbC1